MSKKCQWATFGSHFARPLRRRGASSGALAILQSSGVVLLLAFELVTKGNCFKLDPDGVHDRNNWPRFEYKGR